MGGIGKTTIAKAAFNQFAGDFEASCFIEDFDNAFRKKGVYGLLKEHFKEKLGIDIVVKREKLRHTKILLVLDDVCKPLGATTFLGGFDWLGPGSLILITSRDKQVLVQCRVNDVYEVEGLNKREALQLISSCAPGKKLTHQSLQEIVKYADGSPLALKLYGRELNGMKKEISEKLFNVFKKSYDALSDTEKKIYEKLFNVFKKSYDALSDTEKEIFLHIAFFYRGENVENVMDLLTGCGFFPRIGVDVLVEKCLVSISDEKVQMHNLIHDIGLKIIRDQTEEIDVGYRFFDASNIQTLQKEISKMEGNEDIKAIILDTSNFASESHITIQHMCNLIYLKIYSSIPMNNPEVRFPGKSRYLELRLLHWIGYPLQFFPQDFDVQHLVELYMPESKLETLWGETENVDKLKRITLSHSPQLVNVKALKHAQNIKIIDLRGCSMLKIFPDMDTSNSLEVLDLSGCTELDKIHGLPQTLKKLYLSTTAITEFPTSLCNHLSELAILDMKDCKKLQKVPMGMSNMRSLVTLKLSGCSVLDEIHDFPQNLKELYLDGTALGELPSSIGDLDELSTLDLKNCERLQHLPVALKNLDSLKVLDLSGCTHLQVNTEFLPKFIKLHLPVIPAPVKLKEANHTVDKTHQNTQGKVTGKRYRFMQKVKFLLVSCVVYPK